jgi:hypothetical protein
MTGPPDGEWEWQSVETYAVNPKPGVNSLDFIVRNDATPGGTQTSNPTGLLYKATADYCFTDCRLPGWIDRVNIGVPGSEAGHYLYGFGPIEPEKHGGNWGASDPYRHVPPDDTCRVISSGEPGTYKSVSNNMQDWAALSLDFGCETSSGCTKTLHLRALEGIARDSFTVHIDDLANPPIYTWPGDDQSNEYWRLHVIPVNHLTGRHRVFLKSTQPHWSGWETYGQVAFSFAGVVQRCVWAVEYQFDSYQWDPFPSSFVGTQKVKFVNRSSVDVKNVKATVFRAPPNVIIEDGEVTLGDIPAGGSAWSMDPFTVRVDMTNPQDPSQGIVWEVEYDDCCGNHHRYRVPEFAPPKPAPPPG